MKIEATKERITIGQATTQAIELWLKFKKEKKEFTGNKSCFLWRRK